MVRVANSNSLCQLFEVTDELGTYYYLMERASGEIAGAWADRDYAMSALAEVDPYSLKPRREPDVEIDDNGRRIPPHKNAADSVTLKEVARAFIFADHAESHSWYAYYPTADDSLDAGGSIPSRWFGTYNEAERYVIEAIGKSMRRPRMSGVGMQEMSVNVR